MAIAKPEFSAGYGQYVAVLCVGCHRENYKDSEAVVPGSPDITPNGNLGKWTENQFMNTLHTGVTPEGKKLNPKDMPWNMTKEFTDTEIKSVYLFLKNLPA